MSLQISGIKEKLNEAEVIKSRMTKTIQEDLLEDPFAQMRFSELLKEAIVEAEKLFDHPFKQYSLFEALEEKISNGDLEGYPTRISERPKPEPIMERSD